MRDGSCRKRKPCALHKSWSAAVDGYLAFLTGTSLAEVANGHPASR